MDAERAGHEWVVSAWLEPPNAKSADVCDGVEAFALGGATTERQSNNGP
jgi:hypothetical protein